MPRNDQAAGASQPALEVHTCGQDVEITGIRDFDLDHIFDCGQCFRWNRGEDGSYTGTAYGRIVRMVWDPAKRCCASAAQRRRIFMTFGVGTWIWTEIMGSKIVSGRARSGDT